MLAGLTVGDPKGGPLVMLKYNRFLSLFLLVTLLAASLPAPVLAQRANDPIAQLMAQMTPAEKVGQLFLVTYMGSDVGPNSDIARLIREYRVGGVVLLPGNGNFRNEGNTPLEIARLTMPCKASRWDRRRPLPLP